MSYTARLILSRRVFRCAPHTSSEGSQDSETVPSAIAPVTDSQVVSLRDVFMSGCAIRAVGPFLLAARQSRQACSALAPHRRFAAAVSSLVTQRLSAFRSYLASAYRLCYAPRVIAVRDFLLAARQSKQVCSALAPQRRFPRSHLSLPAKASFLSPCLQSHLP